jgi:hypothetical protein
MPAPALQHASADPVCGANSLQRAMPSRLGRI